MCRFVVFLSAVFVPISIVNRFPTSGRTKIFDDNPGFRKFCAYRSTGHLFSSQSVPHALAVWTQQMTLPIEKSLRSQVILIFSNDNGIAKYFSRQCSREGANWYADVGLLCLSAGGPLWSIASFLRSGKTNLSNCCLFTITYGTFEVPAFFLRWLFSLLLLPENSLWQLELRKPNLESYIERFKRHKCEVFLFSILGISSNTIYRCVARCFILCFLCPKSRSE